MIARASKFVSFTVACAALAIGTPARAAPERCLAPAEWYSLAATGPAKIGEAGLLAEMARREVVLLGERHNDADDHRWELQTLAALQLLRPNMVIGFEAFPRRVQPVLDEWVAGKLTAKQFLERAQWSQVWTLPPDLYLPLFEFARLNRIPMAALNVDQALVRAVREKGWDGVPEALKEDVSRPAPASPDYEQMLLDIYQAHAMAGAQDDAGRADPGFRHFVDSQLAWDRAMAEVLAARARSPDRPLVVGILGSGHVRHGYGVPHQLRALGVNGIGALLPVDADSDCGELKPGLADGIYALASAPQEPPQKPRLGVRIDQKKEGVTIIQVVPGSLAEATGLRVGDRIVTLAGTKIERNGQVIDAVRAQPDGTWLPIQVRRGERTLDLVIKFPPRP
jgi:uncharacterized iron-regulated protein